MHMENMTKNSYIVSVPIKEDSGSTKIQVLQYDKVVAEYWYPRSNERMPLLFNMNECCNPTSKRC